MVGAQLKEVDVSSIGQGWLCNIMKDMKVSF